MRALSGTASLSSSRRLWLHSACHGGQPRNVAARAGQAGNEALPHGIKRGAITMGIVSVACWAAVISAPPRARMASTLSWTSSLARRGRRSSLSQPTGIQ